MNDDFLHRLRAEPPADFLARLKARLDLQPPPAPAALAGSTLKKVVLGLLLSGCVFAMTMILLNRQESKAPPPVANSRPQTTEAVTLPPKPALAPKAAETNSPRMGRVVDTRPTTLTPPAFSYITTKSLEPLLKQLFYSGPRNRSIVAAESASDALAQFCRPLKPDEATPQFALVTRRMQPSESDACAHNLGKVAESVVGHQAIVLARSKLYGGFNLTLGQVFLALAAEVPDPTEPGRLIPNPNKMWSDIDSSLEREPIEFYGPEPSSAAGIAFREILFDAGCRATAKVDDCPGLRRDGVYIEAAPTPSDMLLKLQTKPDAFGILIYGPTFLNSSELTASPIQGVKPTMETIDSESYPGARTLYLYTYRDGYGPPARYLISSFFNRLQGESSAIIPPERSQP